MGFACVKLGKIYDYFYISEISRLHPAVHIHRFSSKSLKSIQLYAYIAPHHPSNRCILLAKFVCRYQFFLLYHEKHTIPIISIIRNRTGKHLLTCPDFLAVNPLFSLVSRSSHLCLLGNWTLIMTFGKLIPWTPSYCKITTQKQKMKKE